MKLLACAHCNDFISPYSKPRKPRWCQCGQFAVWWENPFTGELRVHSKLGHFDKNAYIIGINNAFLRLPEPITAFDVRRIDDECPESYIFKKIHSPIIRIRPGESNDTAWADLPLIEGQPETL